MSINIFSKTHYFSILALTAFLGSQTPLAASNEESEDLTHKGHKQASSSLLKEETKNPIIESLRFREQPQLELFSSSAQSVLIDKANKGDQKAQEQVIERNYWGFIDRGFQSSMWGMGDRGNLSRVNPMVWDNIEKRAIDDDRYAYALIDSYAYFVCWQDRGVPRIPFSQQYPNLFRTIHENAEAGDPLAQFSLGMLYSQFQSFPDYAGLNPQDTMRNLAHEWVKKAAVQGHSLALSVLGLMAQQGYMDPRGRNDVEALQWYLASKSNKLSQNALRNELLIYQPQASRQEGTFQEAILSIKENVESLWGKHNMHIGIHEPHEQFLEGQFAIPQLTKLYEKVIATEEEAVGFLTALQTVTPGFMITGVVLKERRDRAAMIARQISPPYALIVEIDKIEYMTLGETNVSLAAQFLAYVFEIDKKFAKAEETLKKIEKYYRTTLKLAFGTLVTRQCLALRKEDESSTRKFEKQKKYFEELEAHLKPTIKELKREHSLLVMIKEDIRNLIPRTVGKRNQDFFEAHTYLQP